MWHCMQIRDNTDVNISEPLLDLVNQALNNAQDETAIAQAVRLTLDFFASEHPGRSVEVRVPPYRVVQVIGGSTHRRGTPPAVVEMPPIVWLDLVSSRASWQSLLQSGQIFASGVGSDLSDYFSTSESQ